MPSVKLWMLGLALWRRPLGRSSPWLLLALLASAWWLLPAWSSNQEVSHTLRGEVQRVTDGDTVRLLADNGRPYTIRLASIDAPEIGHRGRASQPFSQASRRALADWVEGVTLEARCYEVDHYGRDICDLMLDDGATANARLVAEGLAWANMQHDGKFLRDRGLLELQSEARRAGLGLWSQPGAVEPWVWRDRCWRQGHC